MGSTTPNRGLYKPSIGEAGWGSLVNANWDELDDITVGGGAYLSTHLVRYVDPVNGDDSNSGLGPSYAFETIQAAYNDLKTVAVATYTEVATRQAVGRIYLLPGIHDVGTGVILDWNRTVEIYGTRSGAKDHYAFDSASLVTSSSAAATSFFTADGASASQIFRGLHFENVAFRMDHTINTALTSIIYAKRVGYLTVFNCSFTNADAVTNTSVYAILHNDSTTSDGEGGWARIVRNSVSRMGLYRCTTGGSGGNFNRGTISENVCFYGGSLPMLHLDATMNGQTIANNNLEGSAVACEIGPNGSNTQNMFINNSGEDPSNPPTNPFYKFSGSTSQQIILGGIGSSPQNAGAAGTWVEFGANAYRNIVIGVLDFTAVTITHKRYVSETSHADKNLLIPTNVATPTYTVTNLVTDRAYDANTVVVAELADIVGTLIADLRARGFVK